MSFRFVVTKDNEDRRLDRTLRSIWKEKGSGQLMKAIRKGHVRVNGKKVPFNYRLVREDEISVPWNSPESSRVVSQRTELDIVYSDRNFIFINKPAGLLSQPSRKDEDSVVTRAWASHEGLSGNVPFRPAVVNRLDRNTSGLMVVALNGLALREMQEVFREKLVEKHYYAVVIGKAPSSGVIDTPLYKDKGRNTVTVREDGKDSVTRFELLATNGMLSLLDVNLVTGRSHQARAHLSWAGMPLLGDPKYGKEQSNDIWREKGINRPMLHSSCLKFHSLDGLLSELSSRTFFAPLPEDLEGLLAIMSWSGILSKLK